MQSALKLLCRHLCLYSYNLLEGLPRRAFLYLPWAFFCVVKLWKCLESCERTWWGNALSPECGFGPTHHVQARDSRFLYDDPYNGVKLNMAQEDFYLLVIKRIYSYRNWLHWHGRFSNREVIISLETGKLCSEHSLSFLNEPNTALITFHSPGELLFIVTVPLCGFSTWLFCGSSSMGGSLALLLHELPSIGVVISALRSFVCNQVLTWKIFSWFISFRVWIL